MEEKKLAEVLERMEKKQDTLLESMSVVLNYLLSETIQKEPKDENEKEEMQRKMQVLLIYRDECMELVHGEKYKKHMNESIKEMAVDILNDILENILK
jgi:hypothetical protein